MLEGLVAWVVNTYVGEYFEDLNADQLSVGLLQGEVELENLPMKKDALNFSGYPIEILSGCVGKIKLQIPVYRLYSEPWVIFIEKLYIVIGPVSQIHYDEKEETELCLQRKHVCLQDHETNWMVARDGKKESNDYGVYANWKSYSASLLANVVENIQLKVRDVHIRFEDSSSCKGRQLACGLIIRELTAQSTDENWVPHFIKGDLNDMTWKLAQLQGLSFYWDANATMCGHLERPQMMEQLTKHMDMNDSPNGNSKGKEYLLSSVDATARFKRNCAGEALKSPLQPRIVCDIQLERIPLYFSQNQYHDISQWEKSFHCLSMRWSNRKWRPSSSVSNCPREWWQYAISSYIEPVRQKAQVKGWDSLLQQARDIRDYVSLYREYLKAPELFPIESKTKKENLEAKLNLDVLVTLRELVMEEILRKETVMNNKDKNQEAQGGFLQWMFPSWVGWSTATATPPSIEEDSKSLYEEPMMDENETIIEEELRTVFKTADDTFLKRDTVFVQLNFNLSRGTFILLQNDVEEQAAVEHDDRRHFKGKPIIELEFSDVFVKLETRPRIRSILFEIKLGGLSLCDKMFEKSKFPFIISAQNEDMYYTSAKELGSAFPFSVEKVDNSQQIVNRWLFELVYEKNPQSIQSDYRLVIKTKPLDVVCNLSLLQIIIGIFSHDKADEMMDSESFDIPSAASVHYAQFKEQTKAELQHTWDQMVIGARKSKKEWYIELEIAAPQILIPEDIFDANTNVVIFVLGDLHVFNTLKPPTSHLSSNSITLDDEDDFYTPCSTPEECIESPIDVPEACKTEELLFNRLYESYTLELQNMQVLISSLKDSWKFAQLRGSSSLHILDRFSINIQLYRRTFLTRDPEWPSLVFVASLPKLTAHISEVKVCAVKACIEDLEAYFHHHHPTEPSSSPFSKESLQLKDIAADENEEIDSTTKHKEPSESPSIRQDKTSFVLLQFSVDQMSLDIQSQSQSVAELQISGVKVRLSHCQDRTSMKLTVHSLLVVDALQLYGPDFELLVASHKHVCMDNSSGKILSSDAIDLSESLSPGFGSQSAFVPGESALPWAEGEVDEEVLIFVEYNVTNSGSSEESHNISVKFNNLDIIANQETIIELMGLLKRIKIGSMGKGQLSPSIDARPETKSQMFLKKNSSNVEIFFNFRLLNVLLLRAMKHGCVGHKLATATLRNAEIKAVINNSTEISGTLGGVKVLDLVTEGARHRTIISFGTESMLTKQSDVECSERSLDNDSSSRNVCEALAFKIINKEISNEDDPMTGDNDASPACQLDIFLRMASLYYVHSPHFLFELSCCAVEFKSYLKSLAYSIKSAATEMAKGIVIKSAAFADYDFYQHIDRHKQASAINDDMDLRISCDIFVNSPVIVLRHSSLSAEVFLAHLGHVALTNNKAEPSNITENNKTILSSEKDSLFVEVSGMSLFYVDLDNDVLGVSNMDDSVTDKSAIIWSSDECLRCPIVHDTTIEVSVQPFQDFVATIFGLKSVCSTDEQLKTLFFDMKVISPLNVGFTKKHYEQMLKLIGSFSNNIASVSEDLSMVESLIDFPMPVPFATESVFDSNTNNADSRRSSQVPKGPFLLCCSFELPSLNLALREYMNEKNGLVNLMFNEFNIKYEQKSPYESTLLATLSSLIMEDLHHNSEKKSRSILISSSSKTKASTRPVCPFEPISLSCPDLNRSFSQNGYGLGSPSLPNILCTESVFDQQNGGRLSYGRKAAPKRKRIPSYPNTPPPSPSAHEQDSNKKFASENTLVSLCILFLTEPSDNSGRVKKTSYIDIDFNSLDIALSLDPWNIIFDFLIAGPANSDESSAPEPSHIEQTFGKDALVDLSTESFSLQKSELRISVRSLTVVLRKPEYDLVSANISNFHSQFSRKGKDFHLDGNLGSLSVIDLTPMGVLYPERLVTRGSESLQFSISSGNDDLKDHHASLFFIKGNLSSFMYVHTQRLVTEIVTFFQYFCSKLYSTSSSKSLAEITAEHHHTHVMLDFSAVCPVIVLPANAFSTNVLVIKPQTIVVSNSITKNVFEHPQPSLNVIKPGMLGSSSTFPHMLTSEMGQSSCLDAISIVFGEVTVYSGSHCNLVSEQANDSADRILVFPSYAIQLQDYLLDETFLFNCEVQRSICIFPADKATSITVSGLLSSVFVTLDLDQYKLIRSILSYNFGESLEETIYDPCKEIGQFVLLDTNEEVSTSMMFDIKLSNVTLQLVNNRCLETNERNEMLAKFDFIQSQLTYVVFSDNRKDIDFFSNEIRISDARFRDCPANKQPNVFTNILLPNKEGTTSNLQAELHYRLNNDLTKISILLNNMRVMGIMDFINTTLDFFRCPLPPPPNAVDCHTEIKEKDSSMEMKLNITNTEFVVVEDSSILDSNAVIAKGTAVIVWKPDDSEKPLSFNLEQFEMFSCILGIEDETALSIIDPVNICLDLVKKHTSPIAKLQKQDDIRTLEVSAISLYMRFSYYDLVMFLKILDSVKRQFGEATPVSSPVAPPDSVKVLSDMGFSIPDCQEAISACRGNLDDSAMWLTMNAIPVTTVRMVTHAPMLDSVTPPPASSWTLFSIELRMDSIGLCIINDCRDANIPVLDCHFADVCLTQKLIGNQEGFGLFNFSLDYYNCSLSGWEPLVEPWKCQLKWHSIESFEELSKKMFLSVTTEDVVNVNLTSSFFKLFKMVKDNWTEDYFDRGLSGIQETGFNKSRSQLMPFKLVNLTGCKLWFSTRVLTSKGSLINKEDYRRQSLNSADVLWTPVENFGNCLFTFGKRVKLRHQDSHQETLHQILIRVEGWQTCLPVSLDRVGTYFRNISPTDSYLKSNDRLIFKVKLENNAQKLVTIESSLSISNKLDDVLEVKLECPGLLYGTKEEHIFVTSMETLPVPLPYVHSEMWIRPIDKSLAFSDLPIQWQKVTKPGENSELVRLCNSTRRSVKPYRIAVSIKHGNYPVDGDMMQYRDTANYLSSQVPIIPGHQIIVLPCMEIHNTLPYELNFIIPSSNFLGRLRPGKKYCVCDVDISKPFSFKMSIENFRTSNVINITSARQGSANLVLRDVSDRILILQLHVVLRTSTAVQLVISAPYYLINKTGLPLIFKQDGTQTEAAGQFQEHELARSMTPFMFSFYDDDASTMCSIRIGKGLHVNGLPMWCPRFRLETGVQVRQLHVSQKDNRPDWVYNIGIEVTAGKGKYKNSSIVTLSPRYKVDNRSKHVLEFCQKFAKEGRNFVLSAMPECSFPFHWPRIDLDNLLCVRISSIPGCHWSGGFSVDSIKSFFVNMRDANGVPNFLQTEIVFHGATYYVIFTDAERFPPPIRIDNHSEVSVTYYQTNVSEERLKTTIRPHSSVPYALDEPMLPPYITCSAPGGSLSTYNMNIFREGNQLFYENFIYITFTATLDDEMDTARSTSVTSEFMTKLMGQELVLDVPSGTRVLLGRKEAGKRSQLWRMTSSGMLQHEGSSPPCDLNKSHSSNKQPQKLVLDIATLGPQPTEFIPLMLRKSDARRHNTQTWRFTSDGRLCCGYPNMYVQVANGSLGLKAGNLAVLGPMPKFTSIISKTGIPVEQAICRQKLRGGCGVLSVKVIPDGPTRVLQICDLKEKASPTEIVTDHLSVVTAENRRNKATEFQVNLKLPKGLGVSVINHLNEDLIYIMMHDIMVEICKSSASLTLDGSFKNIQVDNQVCETEWPVFLYVTPSSKSDSQRHLPALHFALHYIQASLMNAQIFKHVIVTVKNLTVHLEEFLVLKLLQLFGFSQTSEDLEVVSKTSNELQSSLFRHVTNDHRYYFSTLKLVLQQVRLSVHTTDRLPPDLQNLKLKLGLRLISFEDAAINLDPFLKMHPFETSRFLFESIADHYKQELKSQAAKIFGAVDFLGNPLGLMNDVTDGISELIHGGNVGGLIKNVAHGLSDSAAKISESLSDGLGSVVIDEKHQMMRKQIRQGSGSSSGTSSRNDHLMAGFRGLGIGILGGFTSIFTETYEGATQEGIQGIFSGLGKGLVGTVAKPAVGLLDLASGAASAVRDTSKKSSRFFQPHRRPPRKVVGHGYLLPRYSLQQALDQQLLNRLSDNSNSELFIAKQVIRSREDDIQVFVSSEKVYFLNTTSSSNNILFEVPLGNLFKCCYIYSSGGTVNETRHYIQLHMKDESLSGAKVPSLRSTKYFSFVESDEYSCRKPQVRCDSGEVAEKAVTQINYAKSSYEERKYTLTDDEDDENTDIDCPR